MAFPQPKHWYRLLKKHLDEAERLNWRWLFVKIISDATERAKRFDIASDSRALSFTFILSLVPLLAIAFTFFKVFGGLQHFIENTLKPLLAKNFPESVADQLNAFIDGFVGNLQTGTLGVVSFVTLLATVLALMMNIEQSFNRIFEARDRRPLLRRLGSYWIMLSATPLVIVLSSAKSSELINAFNTSGGVLKHFGIADVLRFLVGHLVQIIGFGSLFVILPERKPKLTAAFIGALVTHLIFQLLAAINVRYATFVFSNRTNLQLYGSLPLLVLVFLIWVRLVWLGILFGACTCASADQYLDKVKSQQRRTPWHAPHQTILNCVAVLQHYILAFRSQSRPLSNADTSVLLDIPADELEQHQDRLQRKGLIIPIRHEDRDTFMVSATALSCHEKPAHLLADILEIPSLEAEQPNAAAGNSEGDNLVARCRQLLSSLPHADDRGTK